MLNTVLDFLEIDKFGYAGIKFNLNDFINDKELNIYLRKHRGVYSFSLSSEYIPYPLGKSKLVLVGHSKSKKTGIGGRIYRHINGFGNETAYAYKKSSKSIIICAVFVRERGNTAMKKEQHCKKIFKKRLGCLPQGNRW